MKNLLIAGSLLAIAAFAAEGFKVLTKIKIGGIGGWDYVAVDPNTNRVYASHATLVEVVDTTTGKVVGQIPQLHGVHGVAVAPEFGKGFITNGQSNSVTIFDLKTLAKVGEPQTGKIRIRFALSRRPNTSLPSTAGRTIPPPSIPRPTKSSRLSRWAENRRSAQPDGTGKIYVNLEDSSEIAEIDAAKTTITRHASLSPCDSPSGLAIDQKNKKLFSVCDNKMMVVTDIPSLKVIGTAPIGAGPDGAGYDAGLGLAFSSNGQDGTLSIVKEVGGKYQTVDTVPTERGARTMTVDQKNHRVYLLAAEFGPLQAGQKRPPVLPDSFHVLVLGK